MNKRPPKHRPRLGAKQEAWINARIDPDLLRQLEAGAKFKGLSKSEALKEALTMWIRAIAGEDGLLGTLIASLATATDAADHESKLRQALASLNGRLDEASEKADGIRQQIDVVRGEMAPLEQQREEFVKQLDAVDDEKAKIEEIIADVEAEFVGWDVSANELEQLLLDARAAAAMIEFDLEKMAVLAEHAGLGTARSWIRREARDALQRTLDEDDEPGPDPR